MNAKQRYQEVQRLNDLPLGKTCLRLLKQAGADADSNYLYALQLLDWHLSQGNPIPDPADKFHHSLQEQVLMMHNPLDFQPSLVLSALCQNEDVPLVDNASVLNDQIKDRSPEEAASIMAQNLYWRLAQHLLGYRLPD